MKVGNRVLRNFTFLKTIATSRSKKKTLKLLESANTDELLAVVEIAANILNANFCLTKRQKKRLNPYADHVRKLARVKSEKSARSIIQKGEGAFLTALLIPVIVEVVRHFLK